MLTLSGGFLASLPNALESGRAPVAHPGLFFGERICLVAALSLVLAVERPSQEDFGPFCVNRGDNS